MKRLERGQILPLFALMLLESWPWRPLAVDVSNTYASRREYRTAADAASLAGALDLQQTGTRAVGATQYTAARTHAEESLEREFSDTATCILTRQSLRLHVREAALSGVDRHAVALSAPADARSVRPGSVTGPGNRREFVIRPDLHPGIGLRTDRRVAADRRVGRLAARYPVHHLHASDALGPRPCPACAHSPSTAAPTCSSSTATSARTPS